MQVGDCCRRRGSVYQSSSLPKDRSKPTNVTIDKILDVRIIRPNDRVYGVREVLNENPKAEDTDAHVPAPAHEARQLDKKYACRGHRASDRVKRVGGVN